MPNASCGQGLLETTIAIGMIVVGVLSIFAVGTGQLRAIRVSEDRLVAGDLAREGIEIVRSLRDSNWLTGATWMSGLGDASALSGGILVFADVPDAQGSRWSLTPGIAWDTPAAFFYHDGTLARQSISPKTSWRPMQFQRLVTIEPVNDARRVTVEVRWGKPASLFRVTAETMLYNWK
ncbi:hypothetical protein HY624_01140 [Candidatus Uhrbacteria bacterium]|nr:hypothetical protein [Candidatus Uhrbacteria bacterium]